MQQKSQKALLKLLNNIGVVGAIIAGVADIVFVVISVTGIQLDISGKSSVVYAIINACIGILINILLRYQGKKYAELENQNLVNQFYDKKVKEKKYMTIEQWFSLQVFKDIILKGGTTAFSIWGVIKISIEGSKNPVQILITLFTLILFACFGLISMNSAYTRYYNIQIPYMKKYLREKGETENVID